MRRWLLGVCGAGIAWLLASGPALAAESQRPNFVLFIADDLSPDDLGCYGNRAIKTPNIDRLAAEGRLFDRAYLTCSSCSPTRCSLITGRYPHNTGAPELHMPLPAGQFMFPEALRDAGYYTVLAGKNHMGRAIEAAFDEVTPPAGPGGERRWIEHLRRRPQDRPFFMWFASNDAHRDWQTSRQDSQYQPEEVVVPPYLVDGPETRRDLASYYHEISRLDRFVGQVREELQGQGVAENTFIVFMADNGRPFPRCKTRLYDSGTRTPLIVCKPGEIQPARTAALASTIDVAPTVLELAGVAIDERIQGVSLAPVLQDPADTVRDYAFAEHNWHVGQAHERSVRHGDWLYIRNSLPKQALECVESGPKYPAGKELWDAYARGELSESQRDVFLNPRPAEELYNTADDPHQLHNVAGNPGHAETLQRLRHVLDHWTQETGDSLPQRLTPTVDVMGERQGMAREFQRGDMPGADRNAAGLVAKGPVRQ
ncbi:MAG: heparan N-sulfatase [Planctomycetota bacterium]|nr:MAG: heparan N-sulfatase [Planctomycetota bacterium]